MKCTKRWKQSSAIKLLLETLFLAIKMCTDFPTDVIWINTMCAVSLGNHLRAVADAFRPLRTHQHRWFPSDTAHIVFIYITSVGKSVHISMARNRVSKSSLMAELCFHRFVHLIVFRHIFSAFTTSSVLAIRRT